MGQAAGSPSGSGEAGAVSVLAACSLLAALTFIALVVDVGRIARGRAELQKQVDTAALAASYAVGPCTEELGDPAEAAQLTAASNGFAGTLALSPNEVNVGVVSTQAGYRRFTAVADASRAEAVEVRAQMRLARSVVLPRTIGGEIPVEAHAVARTRAIAALSLGSSLGSVDSTRSGLLNDFFGAILGSAVALDVLSYQGVLAARVTLGELLAARGDVGTLEEFLDLQLTAAELLTIVATALDAQGSAAAVDVENLSAAATLTSSAVLGDWLRVTPGSEDAALDAELGVFDLLRTGVVAANGENALVVDPLSLAVPGVATTSLRTVFVERPHIAIGPPGQDDLGVWRTEVQSGQGRVELRMEAAATLPVGGATVTLPLVATFGEASAALSTIHCARLDDPVSRVTAVAEAGPARIGIGAFVDIESSDLIGPATLVEIVLAGLTVASVEGESEYDTSGGSQSLVFEGPFVPHVSEPAAGHTQPVGSDPDAVLEASAETLESAPGLDVTVLGPLPLGVDDDLIESQTLAVLDPLLGEVPSMLGLVLEITGLQPVGGDLTVLWLNARRPELIR